MEIRHTERASGPQSREVTRQDNLVHTMLEVGDDIDLGGNRRLEDELIVAVSASQRVVAVADIDGDVALAGDDPVIAAAEDFP